MSLKRKASFPSIASPQSAQGFIGLPSMDDSPRHLHCRTRKRVRNDRPDDQTVYQNTLRLLFTAQQQVQQVSTPPANQDEDMETDTPTPAADCRQQTLLQFFRPAQTTRQPCPSTPISQFSSEVLQGGNVFPQGPGFGGASPLTSNDGDAMTLAPQPVDRDMDIDMETGSNESSPAPRQWTGPVGWM